MTNLRASGMAVLLYTSDYDNRLPIARSWTDGSSPYATYPDVFHCAALKPGEVGFAMNSVLSCLHRADNSETSPRMLLFESEARNRNAYGIPGRDRIKTPRHMRIWNAFFNDGHAQRQKFVEE